MIIGRKYKNNNTLSNTLTEFSDVTFKASFHMWPLLVVGTPHLQKWWAISLLPLANTVEITTNNMSQQAAN